jgi:hypothetical protein
MIAKMNLDTHDLTLLQQQIKQQHGIDITTRRIEDALMLLQGEEK